jgi:preprotein translocase subunit SecA
VDEEVPLQDYGIFVKVNSDDIMNNRQKFEQLVSAAVQANSLSIAEAMVLLFNPDTKESVKKFLALTDRKAAQGQQAQEQQMAMQQQAIQQQILGDTEKQIQVDRARSENKGQLQMLREELKNRTMEQQTQLDMLKKEQEQNFNLIMEALKEQKNQ